MQITFVVRTDRCARIRLRLDDRQSRLIGLNSLDDGCVFQGLVRAICWCLIIKLRRRLLVEPDRPTHYPCCLGWVGPLFCPHEFIDDKPE